MIRISGVAPTAIPAVETPAHFAGTSQLACSRCARYCRSERSGPTLYRGPPTQSRWGVCVVHLLRVLGFSPAGRSPLEVSAAIRSFWPRTTPHLPQLFCTLFLARFRSVSLIFTWRVFDFVRVFERFSLVSRITLARFHLQPSVLKKKTRRGVVFTLHMASVGGSPSLRALENATNRTLPPLLHFMAFLCSPFSFLSVFLCFYLDLFALGFGEPTAWPGYCFQCCISLFLCAHVILAFTWFLDDVASLVKPLVVLAVSHLACAFLHPSRDLVCGNTVG